MLYSVLYLFLAAQQVLSLFVASLHMLLYMELQFVDLTLVKENWLNA